MRIVVRTSQWRLIEIQNQSGIWIALGYGLTHGWPWSSGNLVRFGWRKAEPPTEKGSVVSATSQLARTINVYNVPRTLFIYVDIRFCPEVRPCPGGVVKCPALHFESMMTSSIWTHERLVVHSLCHCMNYVGISFCSDEQYDGQRIGWQIL